LCSGISFCWRHFLLHPSFPGFEPPASGPGPVVNKSRRPLPDIAGRERRPREQPAQLVGDYTNPILKPRRRKS
jgi:hypothetical protein